MYICDICLPLVRVLSIFYLSSACEFRYTCKSQECLLTCTTCIQNMSGKLCIVVQSIPIRSSLRKSVVSTAVLQLGEDVISRLLQASKDSDIEEGVFSAVLDNDVDFIQVLPFLWFLKWPPIDVAATDHLTLLNFAIVSHCAVVSVQRNNYSVSLHHACQCEWWLMSSAIARLLVVMGSCRCNAVLFRDMWRPGRARSLLSVCNLIIYWEKVKVSQYAC